MKKKKIVIFSIVIVISFLVTSLLHNDNKTVLINEKKEDYLINSNAITMMYETETSSGEYQTTTDTSWPQEGYIFNERLSGCENGGTLSWNSETNRVIMMSNSSDKCYVYFDVKPLTFANYIINDVYTTDGENELYYHDGVGSYTNADQEAGDNSYRYSGANPNNYVCFGSDAETCPDEYLYRIIGVFDEDSDGEYNVKLIKADYITSVMLGTDGRDYYEGDFKYSVSEYKGSMNTSVIAGYRWNNDTSVSSSGSNDWTSSDLNNINLNKNYLNYIGSLWNNMIEYSTWYLGGMSGIFNTAKNFFNGERNNTGYGSNPTRYTAKVGLIYASDYGYSAYPDAWVTNLGSYGSTTIKQNNWLYMGLDEWTLITQTNDVKSVFAIFYDGDFVIGMPSYSFGVRPVFYLKSNISYVSGDGTKNSPYIIS